MQQRGDGTDSVCTATEPEQEEPIACFEVVGDEDVGVADVVVQSVSPCHSCHLSEERAGLGEDTRRGHGPHAGMIVGNLPSRILRQGKEELHHVRAICGELICRSVTADNDVLAHLSLTTFLLAVQGSPLTGGEATGRKLANLENYTYKAWIRFAMTCL